MSENQLTGCVPRALRAVARHDLDQLGLETCALSLAEPEEGTASIAVSAAFQSTIIDGQLETARALRTALQDLLDDSGSGAVGAGAAADEDSAIRARIAELDAEITRLVAIDRDSLVAFNVDVPYVTVRDTGGGDGIAFSKFTYEAAGDSSSPVGLEEKDPTQFVLWDWATSVSVRAGFERHTRLPRGLYRWETDHSKACSWFGAPSHQFVAMKNTAEASGEWVWAHSRGIQTVNDRCFADGRNHLRYFASDDSRRDEGSLGKDRDFFHWVVVAAHVDSRKNFAFHEIKEGGWDDGELRVFQSLTTPLHPVVKLDWIGQIHQQSFGNAKSYAEPEKMGPQDVAHDGTGYIIQILDLPTTDPEELAQPSAPAVTVVGNSITLSKPTGALWWDYLYAIRRGTETEPYWVRAVEVLDETLPFVTVHDLEPGEIYSFQVRAYTRRAQSGYSDRAKATAGPAAPQDLAATAGDSTIALSWTDPSDDSITGYDYRTKTSSAATWGAWQAITGATDTTTRATISGLTNGTTYNVQIRARNAGGASEPSNTASATPAPKVSPQVSISRGAGSVTEGQNITFRLTRTGSTAAGLTVTVSVTETGNMISGTPATSVSIAANTATGSLTVGTVNDSVDELNSVITATVVDGDAYDLGSPSSASVTVRDNDDTPPTIVPCNPVCGANATCDTTNGSCSCDSGYTGDGQSCSPVCTNCDGTGEFCSSPGSCVCGTGYSGSPPNCSPVCTDCSGAGEFCSSPGSCVCGTGYSGSPPNCTANPVPCDRPCGANATCDTTDGTCSCDSGYTGDGQSCSPVCTDCDANATCTAPGVCTCNTGYTGDGQTCTQVCSPACGANATCNNGTCGCDSGYEQINGQGPCVPECGECENRNLQGDCIWQCFSGEICINGTCGNPCDIPGFPCGRQREDAGGDAAAPTSRTPASSDSTATATATPARASGESAVPAAQARPEAVAADGHLLGVDGAAVRIVVYEDFGCTFCREFGRDVMPTLEEEYIDAGTVSLEYRHLAILGPESVRAGAAAECAADQDLFWPYHNLLVGETVRTYKEHARTLRATTAGAALDLETFDACVDAGTHVAAVQEATAAAWSTLAGSGAARIAVPLFLVDDEFWRIGIPTMQELRAEITRVQAASASGE